MKSDTNYKSNVVGAMNVLEEVRRHEASPSLGEAFNIGGGPR